MKDQYSVNEILGAINDLHSSKKDKKTNKIEIKRPITKILDIPSNTLKLIEEAEKTIISKLRLK